tara:strand:+ start:5194 stop:5502 length:309 start_codon:yes stop_codon:yes gene_type:complete
MTQSTFETKAPTFIFHKDLFSYHGGYLMYGNDLNDQVFIARFKYGQKNWRAWANFLCKNFTVAEYLQAADETSPRDAIESKGFYDDTTVRVLRAKIKRLEAK